MDAVKFFIEKARLCKSHDDEDCQKCELHDICDVVKKAKEVVAIVEKWSAEHPQKTRAMDFFEKHPNAPKYQNGSPKTCARNCGYCDGCVQSGAAAPCLACWNEPMEETK